MTSSQTIIARKSHGIDLRKIVSKTKLPIAIYDERGVRVGNVVALRIAASCVVGDVEMIPKQQAVGTLSLRPNPQQIVQGCQ